jgi:hypothetical protein
MRREAWVSEGREADGVWEGRPYLQSDFSDAMDLTPRRLNQSDLGDDWEA